MTDWKQFAVTAEQMITLDEQVISNYGVQLIQMMENAGRNLADFARRMLKGDVSGKTIFILCGSGNNGGGGMVAARHLHNWGAKVQVVLAAEPNRLKDIPAQQWRTMNALGLVTHSQSLPQTSLIIDALLGYGARGDPRPPISEWINGANSSGAPILSLDLPSGLNATTGLPGTPCITATATLTLAIPKTGLFVEPARAYIGELFLADIGIPPNVFRDLFPAFVNDSLFESDTVIKISGTGSMRRPTPPKSGAT